MNAKRTHVEAPRTRRGDGIVDTILDHAFPADISKLRLWAGFPGFETIGVSLGPDFIYYQIHRCSSVETIDG